jgi:hypothetical protein
VAASAVGFESSLSLGIEIGLGKDGARRVSRAKKKNVEYFVRHRDLPESAQTLKLG